MELMTGVSLCQWLQVLPIDTVCYEDQGGVVDTFMYKGLVTNYGEGGGLQNGRGGHVKFYPYEKGGGEQKRF